MRKRFFFYTVLLVSITLIITNILVYFWIQNTYRDEIKELSTIDNTFFGFICLSIFVGFIFSIFMALLISKYLTKPISVLSKVTSKIAGGDYSIRLQTNSKDEIGRFAEAFNIMADKLKTSFDDLNTRKLELEWVMDSMLNGVIAVDKNQKIIFINSKAIEMFGLPFANYKKQNLFKVVRVNALEHLLESAKEQSKSVSDNFNFLNESERVYKAFINILSSSERTTKIGNVIVIQDITEIIKLEQIRTQFVSNVTHELRTPLTSIRGFIDTLRSGAIDDKNVSEKFLQIIDIEAERLYSLINDILELSEIESMEGDKKISSFNLCELTEEVIHLLQSNADIKNVKILYNPTQQINYNANRYRIKQLLINLVDNAIKYNHENGSVTIDTSFEPGRIKIVVADTGIGIDKENIDRIFERFYRVDKSRSKAIGGTGLGLSIVKHIVHLYDGDITINSEYGKGTKFIVQLPS